MDNQQPQQYQSPSQPQPMQTQGMSEDTKSIISALLLVGFYPVGIFVAWFWPKWPVWVKILISLPLFGIIMAIILIALNPAGLPR